ncbi:hypothetical protein DD592_26905 [Enterobacter cloacae complex sp. 2DZ2F20B]|nr:hypothetical protein DD592_26905 [Enterobacter cloacae complex sp. 2DZ2F20B]
MIMRNAEVSCTRLQNLEQLSIEKHGEISGIYMNNLEIYVINVYRSPSGDLNKFLSTLVKVFGIINTLKNNIILTGDFNVKFDKEDPLKDCLLDFMRTYGLFHLVEFPTRNNNCLDNVFNNLDHALFQISP